MNSHTVTSSILGARSSAMLAMTATVAAIIVGLVCSFGSVLLAVLMVGAIAALFLLLRPRIMLFVLAIVVFVANGVVQFFLGFHQLQWVSSLLGMGLLIVALPKLVESKSSLSQRHIELSPGLFLCFFIFILFVSSIINAVSVSQFLVGMRTYLPYIGVFAALAAGLISHGLVKRLYYFFLGVVAIQFPFCLYQKLAVVPERVAAGAFGSSFDSIVGTFGGGPYGGGSSGSMAVFIVIALLICVSLWREKNLSSTAAIAVVAASLLTTAIAEVKVVFALLPIGFLLLFKDLIFKRPVAFLAFTLMGTLALSTVLFAYYKLYWEDSARGGVEATITQRFAYSFDPTFMPRPDWPGRLTGLAIWEKHHDVLEDPITTAIGHGVAGATSSSALMEPSRETLRYGFGLDVTGMTKLLWESGVLGVLAFSGMLMSCALSAARQANNPQLSSWHRAVCRAIFAAMPVLILALFYEVTTVSSPPLQFLAMFLVGCVACWKKTTSGDGVSRSIGTAR